MIQKCFNDEFLEFPVSRLVYTKRLPANIKSSDKYKAILASIREVGLVEPIMIYPDEGGRTLKVLDGHLRIEALLELSIEKAFCIISTIPDSFTPNKQVNQIAVIQQHNMIKKAIDSGVSVKKLSAALGVGEELINRRYSLAKGIDPEVISRLANHIVPFKIFAVIKKMKPARQVEVVKLMIDLDNFTIKFAESLLYATEDKYLVNPTTQRSVNGLNESISRLEKEMAALQLEVVDIEMSYSDKVLRFMIVKNHIRGLLGNSRVVLWLLENQPDYLRILKGISDVNSLDNI